MNTLGKSLTVSLVAVTSLVGLTACGGSDNSSSSSTTTAASTATATDTSGSTDSSAAAGGDSTPAGDIPVELSEYMFMPATITAKAGSDTFFLTNKGTIPHNFVIQLPSGAKTAPTLDPGKTEEFKVDALKAGTYTIICSLPGHKQSGMVGKLIVK